MAFCLKTDAGVQRAIWLHVRSTPLFRDVEEKRAGRGIDALDETIRRWFLKFGRTADRVVRPK